MVPEILWRILLVVLVALAALLAVVVGPTRIKRTLGELRPRIVAVLPELGLLGIILALNQVARQYSPDVAWIIGLEVTDTIYRIEGDFVPWLQSVSTAETSYFFSRVYVYGYIVLLVFPALAYVAHTTNKPLRVLLLAYGLNYLIGLVCYVVIIAYGPRNLIPELVEQPLYASFPEYQTLTRQVNRSINVFPSLHTSLSVTVMLMAYRTREAFPRWLPVATVLGASVVVSTMYLGIHWAIDVVAGIALAVLSVALAAAVVRRGSDETFLPAGLYSRLAG